VVFLDRIAPPRGVGATWLAEVRADRRMAGETKALAVAGELALHISDRPRISFAVQFFCRPGPYQAAMIAKAAGKGAGAAKAN
jgi:hypothetical protein